MASASFYKLDNENNQLKNKISDLTPRIRTQIPFDLPLTEKGFRKRQELYSIIGPCRFEKMEWKEIIAMLAIEYPYLPRDENTLRDTLNAGDAGCLDVWPPDLDEWRKLAEEMKKSKNRNSGHPIK